MENLVITVSGSVVDKAQRLYKAQNASDIFAGVKPEKMPPSFLTDIIEKNVDSALKQKGKQVQQKRAVALAELQAKGLNYKDACKALGIILTDAQAAEHVPTPAVVTGK